MAAYKVVIGPKTFTLRIDTDGASKNYGSTSHQSQTSFTFNGKSIAADKVPFIVKPISDRSTKMGQCAVLIDNNKHTNTYCIIGDAGPSANGWGEVSLKAAWNLGYSEKQANGSRGPRSNFTIIVFTDSVPKWNSKKDLNSQIEAECKKRCETYKQVVQTYTAKSAHNASSGDSSDPSIVVTTGTYKESQQLVNLDVVKQYLITINRNTDVSKLNFSKLKKEDVVGAMVEAGYYMNSKRHIASRFRNPSIDLQVKTLNRNNILYGLYTYSRANSVVEAKKELEQLEYVLDQYPPILGIWVRIQLHGKTKAINDKILDEYRSKLVEYGLKSKIGIIANKSELNSIHWKNHKNNWLLWYIDKVKNIDTVDDQLLTPTFFDI